MTLNAGGSVARFFNVPESSGNVFELWRSLPAAAPIPVTPCSRYFQSLEQAVGLLWATIGLPPGRYCVDPGAPRLMAAVASELYPDRRQLPMAPRRGDRLVEPLCAAHERITGAGIMRVESDYDPVPAREAVAA
jgi:FlaA1/EpsC-like NDP-sugar epimerase